MPFEGCGSVHPCAAGRVVGAMDDGEAEAAEAAGLVECPICYVLSDDVDVLDHWNVEGDVSSHRMCGTCRAFCKQCPFCRAVIIKDSILEFISSIVAMVSLQALSADTNETRDERAEVWHVWEFFELEHEGQPAVVRSVAKMILEDEGFAGAFRAGVEQGQDWLRDMAGIIFRFSGMSIDGELPGLAQGQHDLLAEAVESILQPFEWRDPYLNGTFYGALYMQAILPWACAVRAGVAKDALGNIVKRAGHAMVDCYKAGGRAPFFRRNVMENMHPEYVELTHITIWGSQEEDIVWQAFVKPQSRPMLPSQPQPRLAQAPEQALEPEPVCSAVASAVEPEAADPEAALPAEPSRQLAE